VQRARLAVHFLFSLTTFIPVLSPAVGSQE
jgi:hypothetical protein